MKRETIIPLNEADWLRMRKFDLTSTDVADLFGIGRTSAFELWHRKKSQSDSDFVGNERTEWGLHLQDGIASKFAKDNNWSVRRMNEYIRIPELRLGSSFDFEITDRNEERSENGILEVKNVDSLVYKNDWLIGEDGEIEATPAIELQLQHQLMVSGYSHGYIGVCVGGNKGILLPRDYSINIQKAIIAKSKIFWKSIDDNLPPDPDFTKDAEFIVSLYQSAEPGTVVDLTGDEDVEDALKAYKAAGDAIKEHEQDRAAIKARLLMKIGEAEKVVFSGGTVSAGLVGPTLIEAYERKGYRMFTPRFKKEWK